MTGDATRSEFRQGNTIRNYVVPLMSVAFDQPDGSFRPISLLGTAFFIGRRGFAMTATHVVEPMIGSEQGVAALFCDDDGVWFPVLVEHTERHENHDVAVLKIQQQPPNFMWHGIVTIDRVRWFGSSSHYSLWGYPQTVATEIVEEGQFKWRPDLIYSEGHVRRRMTSIPLEYIPGTHFFELSEVAGRCCSGSPVVARPHSGFPLTLMGIYTGERLDNDSTSVGFATRIDSVQDWAPTLLGRTIAEECSPEEFVEDWT